MEQDRLARRIRSYVLRQGRLTSGQASAIENFWQRYGIDNSTAVLDLDHEFGRSAPRSLDIGTGMGDASIKLASSHPENDYLAVEVHRPGVGSLIRQAEAKKIVNIRIICNDIIEVLKHQLADDAFEHVYIFFPDPWPKKRHHKRRLINTEFVSLVLKKLRPQGKLFIATDWPALAEHVLAICDNHGGLINMAGKGHTAPRPLWRPLTKFERRGKAADHAIHDFIYCLSRSLSD